MIAGIIGPSIKEVMDGQPFLIRYSMERLRNCRCSLGGHVLQLMSPLGHDCTRLLEDCTIRDCKNESGWEWLYVVCALNSV